MNKERKKDWKEKTKLVHNCIERCREKEGFARSFYDNLFFLKPGLKNYFKNTDWEHQKKALVFSLEHLSYFWDEKDKDSFHRKQILRISDTHSRKNLNIHPHEYYYWIDALILTLKQHDKDWHDDLQYYLRECLFFPISFIISRYFS